MLHFAWTEIFADHSRILGHYDGRFLADDDL
jgi:hypothetical protein